MSNQEELLIVLEKWLRDIVKEEILKFNGDRCKEIVEELTKIGGSI